MRDRAARMVARPPSSRRPRVLLASRIFAPEAAAATFRLQALVRGLVDAGARVEVLTTQPPPSVRASDPEASRRVDRSLGDTRVSRWPALRDATGYVRGYLPYLSFDLPLAVRLLAAPLPDVVVVEPPPTTGAVARVALGARSLLARRPVPYVYYAADVWSDATASMGAPALVVRAMRWVEAFAMRGADAVVAVSEGVAERVRALAPRASITVVPNGIDTGVFTPDGEPHPEAPGTPYLVYAGTASEWQGAEIFAEAMREVVRAEPTARVVFLGQGSSWPALQRIRDELPNGAIELRPLAPAHEAAAWQRGAAAALVSVRPGIGYDFAYPTKVVAALACGTPVLYAGPGPAAQDIRAHGLGRAVAYDIAQVAQAMIEAFSGDLIVGGGDATALSEWVREHRSLAATGRAAAEVTLGRAGPALGSSARSLRDP